MRRGKSITGSVRVAVFGISAERLINLCATSEIAFRGVKTSGDGETELTVKPSGLRKLRELEKRGLLSLSVKESFGIPYFFKGLRRRYALFLGLLLSVGAVWTSSFYIWQIEVRGNREIPTAVILSALREEGVRPGASAFSVDNRMLENRLVLKIPKLAWITVNVRGSTAWVIVREKTDKPVRKEKSELRAKRGGVVVKVVVTRGTATVQKGDTVAEGQLLCESFPWENRAEARVTARTWYELSEAIPVSCVKKEYTGAEKGRSAAVFGEKRINFCFTGGNPYACCDKITENKRLSFLDRGLLPTSVLRESFYEWRPMAAELSEREAEAILKARLISRLNGMIGSGSVTDTGFELRREDGLYVLTLRAECLEEIADL